MTGQRTISGNRRRRRVVVGAAFTLLVAATGLAGIEAAAAAPRGPLRDARRRQQRQPGAVPPPPPPAGATSACVDKNKRQCAKDADCALDGAGGCVPAPVPCNGLAGEAACLEADCRWRSRKQQCVKPKQEKGGVACRAGGDGRGAGCRAGEYCKLATGACAALAPLELGGGACVSTRVRCAARDAPVCGCDGVTHAHACAARAAGVSVAREGACRRPPARPPPRPAATCRAGADGRSADCGEGAFCRLEAGTCGALAAAATGDGRCADRAEVCAARRAPVCGCDGVTYANECRARAAGMSVAAKGECAEAVGPGVQGGVCSAGADGRSDACGKGAFCSLDAGVCRGLAAAATATGTCWANTGIACTMQYDPVCGCDGVTYSNGCMATFKGMSVAAKGECAEAAGPDVQGSACLAGADGRFDVCGEGQFCKLDTGVCQGLAAAATAGGACEAKAKACAKIMDPVCGCDGKSYANECQARAAGVSVATKGRCTKPAGPKVQGSACLAGADGRSDVCGKGAFCKLDAGVCQGLPATAKAAGACEANTGIACTAEMDPVCGCDGKSYANECQARAAGVSVATKGRCAKPAGPKVQGSACLAGADVRSDVCGKGAFCKLDAGVCQGLAAMATAAGACEANTGIACTAEMDPVCGCDGVTYSNACMAHVEGMSVSSRGRCSPKSNGGDGPPLESTCRPGWCSKDGATCTRGTETCCGATYASETCQCTDVNGSLQYGCFYTDACLGGCSSAVEEREPEPEPALQSDCEVASNGRGETSCGTDKFCRLGAGACHNLGPAVKGGGRCGAAAEVCTMQMEPTCGCDGVTYSNACLADAARMSVAYEGPCDAKKTDGGKDAGGRPKHNVWD